MRRSKPEISDWITYLISQRNIGFTILIMLISTFFISFGFILGYEQKLQIELFYTLILLEFILLALFFILLKFRLLKTSQLLKKIMEGKILDSEKIREEWLKKRE